MKILLLCLLVAGSATVCLAAEEAIAKRTINVEFDAPATNYLVQIQEVYRLADELWVISKVSTDPHDEEGGAAITRVSDQITIKAAEDLTVVHWVVGKNWNWGDDTESLRYVNQVDVKQKLKEQMAVRIWRRPQPKADEFAPSQPTLFDLWRSLRNSSTTPNASDD